MKIRKKDSQFFLVGCGLLFVPSIIRVSVLKSQWALINIISWTGIILLTRRYYGGGRVVLSKKGRNGVLNPMLLLLLVVLFLLEGMMLPKFSIESKIKYVYATIFPCYILYTTLPKNEIIRYVKIFAKMLTVASTLVVICGVLDMFAGTAIGKMIAEFTAADSLIESIRQGRMVSYFGHPLLTSEVMILCFLFNTVVNYCVEKKTVIATVYNALVCVIGIGLCGSKTGMVLIIISFALLYVNKKGFKYIILVAAAVYWAYSYGLLNTVIGRFLVGFKTGDLTTGRNTALALLLKSGYLKFNFFLGHAGTELSERMIAALEYPPLRWAYLFGIWFSAVMCVVLFLIPIIRTFKMGNMKIFVALLILILDVNSYNGITTQSDQMLLYCVSAFLLVNLSCTVREDKNEDMSIGSKLIYARRDTKSRNNNTE